MFSGKDIDSEWYSFVAATLGRPATRSVVWTNLRGHNATAFKRRKKLSWTKVLCYFCCWVEGNNTCLSHLRHHQPPGQRDLRSHLPLSSVRLSVCITHCRQSFFNVHAAARSNARHMHSLLTYLKFGLLGRRRLCNDRQRCLTDRPTCCFLSLAPAGGSSICHRLIHRSVTGSFTVRAFYCWQSRKRN